LSKPSGTILIDLSISPNCKLQNSPGICIDLSTDPDTDPDPDPDSDPDPDPDPDSDSDPGNENNLTKFANIATMPMPSNLSGKKRYRSVDDYDDACIKALLELKHK
jgi:hypothetical protein